MPVRWDGATGENIVWKVPVPGQGHGSPVIWDDHLFLLACLPDSQQRVLRCLDTRTGALRWQQTVVASPLETKHQLNSFASSTPATDGQLVYVTFLEVGTETIPAPNVGTPRPVTPGRMVVAAYDLEGNQKWLVKPGGFVSAHGFCSNPVLFQNLVIVNGDHDGDSYIVALDKATGQTVWKAPREHKTRSYVTPLLRTIDGRTQLVLSGSKCIVSLDPRDGSVHWVIDGPTEQFVASMVYDGSLLFMAAGFPTYHVMGIRPDGRGDVTDSHVAWHSTNAKCYVPSPVVVDGYLLVADDRGTANCFTASTGERLWQERLGKHYSASLVTAGGLVYLLADDGITKVVKPGPELQVVAENELGEYCFASPGIAAGRLFIRGEQHLYCIGSR
ncbi:MAG: PQQ-binding-like beta-propeller repeat protein [Pirellulaceae bacterium]|nr:PQQ-binding-like beta-propeller repeat protein [Pirellulaceae bacterium]